MERLTKKQKPVDLLGDGTICNYGVPNHYEYHTATAVANKLGELEDIEEELGISILDFYKICKAEYIWAEIELDLTNRFDQFIPLKIKGINVNFKRILLEKNDYNLNSVPFNMYKICFWLSKNKSE